MILTITIAFLAWIVLAVIAGLIWGRAIRASHEVRWSDQDDFEPSHWAQKEWTP